MLLKIYKTKELSFKNEMSLGREMMKCMVEFHERNQLDQNRSQRNHHLRTLPSRWQKWGFRTRYLLLSYDLFLKSCPCGCFPGRASGKEPACQCRRHERRGFSPWVGKVPWRRAWQPTPGFLPGESRGHRAWQATVHRVAKSGTQPRRLSMRTRTVAVDALSGWRGSAEQASGAVFLW